MYPANSFAFRHVLDQVAVTKANSIIEAGIGSGQAIPVWQSANLEITGFDNNPERVTDSRAVMAHAGLDQAMVVCADAAIAETLTAVPNNGTADILVGMGVLPHCPDLQGAVDNLTRMVRPGGWVFLELRNVLFSLFTFNRYTYDLFDQVMLEGVQPEVRAAGLDFIASRVLMDVPSNPAPLEQFHNPLTVASELSDTALTNIRLLPFHYHAAPPAADVSPQRLDDASAVLESRDDDWRVLLMCSAFLLAGQRRS